MTNTITLSSDMLQLYLIDRGRAIEYQLNTNNGVLIGMLMGQVTVVSAKEAPQDQEEDDDLEKIPTVLRPVPTTKDKANKKEDSEKQKIFIPNRITLPTDNAQWTLFFNQKTKTLGIIGTTDIDVGSGAPPAPPKCKVKFVDLISFVVNIRRRDNNLELFLLKR